MSHFYRANLCLLFLLLTSALQLTPGLQAYQTDSLGFDAGKVFDQVTETVETNFYDPKFDFASWKQIAANKRKAALAAVTRDEFASVVNELLAELKTSHTYYYSTHNPKRYQLFGIFHRAYPEEDSKKLCVYEGIGFETKLVAGKRLVTAIYEGLSAARAGIRFADEIIAVDGRPFNPILSFKGRSEKEVRMKIKRNGEELTIPVMVETLDGRTMFEKTLESSIQVVQFSGKKIGYIHLRSYAGTKYQEALRSTILFGSLSQCDGLVLDIRDGWGGADLNYLNLFRQPIANVESISRNGIKGSYSGVWGKTVTLLTNNKSTSGKELFAYGFRKLKLGKIVGENTAGAVVAGRSFLMPNGDALYLAVLDVKVDGVRLEGRGVAPDIVVKRPLQSESTNEKSPDLLDDPQIKAAIEQAFRDISADD